MKKMFSTRRKFGIAAGWALVAMCLAAIFYLSHQPSEQSAELSQEVMSGFFAIFSKLSGLIGHDAFRSCAHFAEYTGLGALLFHAFLQTYGYARPAISFCLAAAYSVTDEFHQLFVPGRAFQLSDIAVDCAGSALGVAVCCLLFVLIKGHIDKRKRQGIH